MASERELGGGLAGTWFEPGLASDVGAVVLGGSSGAVTTERARLLADQGLHVAALRWFGGVGQSPGICEVPIETFAHAIDQLVAAGCQRIVVLGTSKGAEAALVTASVDPRVNLVVALSPSSVVWANVGPGADGFEWPLRSSFSWRGAPLPFVPHEAEALLSVGRLPPVSYLQLFERSLDRFPEEVHRAAIPIAQTRADVILAAGGDDQLWPSLRFAHDLANRLEVAGRTPTLLTSPKAGHRILFPGETTIRSPFNAHGGNDDDDVALGSQVWAELTGWVRRTGASRV
jgi:hypothetical protein